MNIFVNIFYNFENMPKLPLPQSHLWYKRKKGSEGFFPLRKKTLMMWLALPFVVHLWHFPRNLFVLSLPVLLSVSSRLYRSHCKFRLFLQSLMNRKKIYAILKLIKSFRFELNYFMMKGRNMLTAQIMSENRFLESTSVSIK